MKTRIVVTFESPYDLVDAVGMLSVSLQDFPGGWITRMTSAYTMFREDEDD